MSSSARSTVLSYYNSLESRIGYRLFLGGTRHFGWYESERAWPWPIDPALRAMEERLVEALDCDKGSKILDAGCGVGHVALYLAKRAGFRVDCIDIIPHHIEKCARNIQAAGMGDSVSVRYGDYHNLEGFGDNEFEGAFTLETFVHATKPREALREFLRVLKPGGRLVMYEYDHMRWETAPKHLTQEVKTINTVVGMPAFDAWEIDGLGEMAREVGFRHVEVTDMSRNIVPMLWFFYVCAYIPYLVFCLFGIQNLFPNTMSGVAAYRGRSIWRYVQVKAIK